MFRHKKIPNRFCIILFLVTMVVSAMVSEYCFAIEVKNVPKNNGKPYKLMNNNSPGFSKKLLRKKKFQKYGKLDKYGRCTSCTVIVSKKTLARKNRESISSVKPTGWKQRMVGSDYLYNRCHLIGYQLTGQNANPKNLITGTKYMNINGMLRFENQVASYVRRTGNKVIYRVRPYFKKKNRLASGVQMEAMSIKDRGKSLHFNVYCYNKQPKVKIYYSNGKAIVTKKLKRIKKKYKRIGKIEILSVYITPTGSCFHKRTCPTVSIARTRGTLEKKSRKWCLGSGYRSCKVCNP